MISGGQPTIYVSDMDRAVEFYRDTLGLTLAFQAGSHYAMIDAGGGTVLGLHPSGPESPKPGARGSISVGLKVTAPLDQVVAELTKRGVKFRGPVKDDGPVRLAFFGDPDDNDLYLVESAWGRK